MRPFRAGPWIALCALVFVASLAVCLWLSAGETGEQVEILLDGRLVRRVRLSQDDVILVEGEDGYNRVVVAGGQVYVEAADCPDQTCVRMGPLRSRALPIVCLPHGLVVRFAQDAAAPSDDLDALTY